jgi:hypothetical protein
MRSDPRWIEAKYAGVDANGNAFKKGETVFYFPLTKKIFSGEAADAEARSFEAARFDEDGF